MSLLEDDKNANSQNAKPTLRPIVEVDENKLGTKQEEERNSLLDSQKSATFPDVPVKLQQNNLAQTQSEAKYKSEVDLIQRR